MNRNIKLVIALFNREISAPFSGLGASAKAHRNPAVSDRH